MRDGLCETRPAMPKANFGSPTASIGCDEVYVRLVPEQHEKSDANSHYRTHHRGGA